MKEATGKFFSFEYFPPKTAEGVENLKKRIVRMKNLNPMFVDFTWGAGGSTSDLSLDLTACAKNELGCVANMHLTCTNQTSSLADDALAKCKAVGVRNICALRGYPPRGSDKWEATEGGFTCALDLVKRIREVHGDYFTVSIAGYPEGHPDAIEEVAEGFESLSVSEKRRCRVVTEEDGTQKVFVCRDEKFKGEMEYLKAKVDNGEEVKFTRVERPHLVFAGQQLKGDPIYITNAAQYGMGTNPGTGANNDDACFTLVMPVAGGEEAEVSV